MLASGASRLRRVGIVWPVAWVVIGLVLLFSVRASVVCVASNCPYRRSSRRRNPSSSSNTSPIPPTQSQPFHRLVDIGKYILRTKRTPVSLVRAAHALFPHISFFSLLSSSPPIPHCSGNNLRQQRASCRGGRRMRQTSLASSLGFKRGWKGDVWRDVW